MCTGILYVYLVLCTAGSPGWGAAEASCKAKCEAKAKAKAKAKAAPLPGSSGVTEQTAKTVDQLVSELSVLSALMEGNFFWWYCGPDLWISI